MTTNQTPATKRIAIAKHTPGPWHIDAGRHGIHIRSGDPSSPLGGELVASVFNAADADLIVYAPVLAAEVSRLEDDLEALRKTLQRELLQKTLRDEFAMRAMQALIAAPQTHEDGIYTGMLRSLSHDLSYTGGVRGCVAVTAWAMADAMLAARPGEPR